MLTGDTWFVQVEGQHYGPYTTTQMQGFLTEGRIGPTSYVSTNQNQAFTELQQFAAFNPAIMPVTIPQTSSLAQHAATPQTPTPDVIRRPGQPEPQSDTPAVPIAPLHTDPLIAHAPTSTPSQSTVQPQTAFKAQTEANAPQTTETVHLVMAELRGGQSMGFLRALQNFGTAQRIGDSIWLLRSASTISEIRNALSQTLGAEDRLFLMDSFNGKTAWFNIGADMGERIRKLWDFSDTEN